MIISNNWLWCCLPNNYHKIQILYKVCSRCFVLVSRRVAMSLSSEKFTVGHCMWIDLVCVPYSSDVFKRKWILRLLFWQQVSKGWYQHQLSNLYLINYRQINKNTLQKFGLFVFNCDVVFIWYRFTHHSSTMCRMILHDGIPSVSLTLSLLG